MLKKIKTIEVGANIFEENDLLAEKNQKIFKEYGVFAINVMGSPGSGKTSFLEKTISELKEKFSSGVIEGDIKGSLDAERLAALDIPVVQINTGGACHLDAFMVHKGLKELPLKDIDILFVENVGNLVCPAEFDIGTLLNLVVASIPEGEDKPLKYPLMFKIADICILNKTDLLPYMDFDLELFRKYLADVSSCKLLPLSVKTGEGFTAWIDTFSDIYSQYLKPTIEWKGKIVIAGLGDPLKADDVAGSLVAENLKKTIKREDVMVIDAGNSFENYWGVIERFAPDTIVIIDAVDFGGRAGDIKIMDWKEIEETTVSTHGISLPLLLSYIQKSTGAKCYIIGIQPERIALSEGVSPSVEMSIKELTKKITFELCK